MNTFSNRRIIFWGTFDPTNPRIQIIQYGLQLLGREFEVINRPLWRGGDLKKSKMSNVSLAIRAFKSFYAYAWLIFELVRKGKGALVVVSHPGLIDCLVVWPFVLLLRGKLIWDVFVSTYNTLVEDRLVFKPQSILARILFVLEKCAYRICDGFFLDTDEHRAYIIKTFGLSHKHSFVVPVGFDERIFSGRSFHDMAANLTPQSRFLVLFYGTFIPLHGIQVILDAITLASKANAPLDFLIVGKGQEEQKVLEYFEKTHPDNAKWLPWVKYNDLFGLILSADVVLGIFGTTVKASLVVPNKIYQSLAVGTAIVTRVGSAEVVLEDWAQDGVWFVESGNPIALFDKILEVVHAPISHDRLASSKRASESFSSRAIARIFLNEVALI